MRTRFFVPCCLLLLAACGTLPNAHKPTEQPPPTDRTYIYYVVIADTSESYWELRATMFRFHEKSGLEIDTLNRYFNTQRGKLILKEDDPNELYRGAYKPRKRPSKTLSIEYLDTYNGPVNSTAMACMVGMFEKPRQAKRLVRKWRREFPKIYMQEVRIDVHMYD